MQKPNTPCSSHNKKFTNTLIGIILLLIGALLILRQSGFPVPRWIFGWEMILITIGIFVGIKTKFRDFGWLVMIAIGVLFLLKDIYPYTPIRNYIWPALFILFGLVFVLRSFITKEKTNRQDRLENGEEGTDVSKNDILDLAAVFGGIKQTVVSKNFKGGEVVCVFGGAEINLTQADFTDIIEIELVQVFGGTKLIIPANWKIRSESAVVFGGIEDKRPQSLNPETEKVLVIRGTTLFGGIDIRSF